MDLGLPEQVVAVFANAIQLGEDGFVVDALALDIEEGPFGEVMGEERVGTSSPGTTGACALDHQRDGQAPHRRPPCAASALLQLRRSLTHLQINIIFNHSTPKALLLKSNQSPPVRKMLLTTLLTEQIHY